MANEQNESNVIDPSKPIPATPESYGTHEMKPSALVDKHRVHEREFENNSK